MFILYTTVLIKLCTQQREQRVNGWQQQRGLENTQYLEKERYSNWYIQSQYTRYKKWDDTEIYCHYRSRRKRRSQHEHLEIRYRTKDNTQTTALQKTDLTTRWEIDKTNEATHRYLIRTRNLWSKPTSIFWNPLEWTALVWLFVSYVRLYWTKFAVSIARLRLIYVVLKTIQKCA